MDEIQLKIEFWLEFPDLGDITGAVDFVYSTTRV